MTERWVGMMDEARVAAAGRPTAAVPSQSTAPLIWRVRGNAVPDPLPPPGRTAAGA